MPSFRSPLIVAAALCLAGFALWFLHAQVEVPLASDLGIGSSSSLLGAAVLVTRLGGAAALIPVALAFVLLLAIRGRRDLAIWLFATIATGRIATELLKILIGRARPDETGWLVDVSSASFPSSHSAGSMLTVVALLILFRPRTPIVIAALAFPMLVGASRVMLAVHWPSDVLVGWGIGLGWAALAARWLPARAIDGSRSDGVRL